MPAHHCPLMAALAQRHAGVLPVLLDVVGIAWACCITHTAGQFLDLLQVFSFSLGWVVVHFFLWIGLPSAFLLARYAR